MKLTKKKAIELSIKKWELIVGCDGYVDDIDDHIPELRGMQNLCGLCELYLDTGKGKLDICHKCPIRPKVLDYDELSFVGCLQYCHPFHYWINHSTKENAQKVLDLIKSIK